MDKIKARANEARDLQSHHVFIAVMGEITDAAVALFCDANSGIEAISQAHEKVRAVQLVRDALQARIDAEIVEDHRKAQHRD